MFCPCCNIGIDYVQMKNHPHYIGSLQKALRFWQFSYLVKIIEK